MTHRARHAPWRDVAARSAHAVAASHGCGRSTVATTGRSVMEVASVLAAGGALDTSSAAALGIGLTGLGAALAQGRAVAAALEGVTRNPGSLAGARGLMIL